MNKQKLVILLAVITTIGTLGGGAASGVITIDMFNTDNSKVDNSQTISGDSNTVVNIDGEGLTCEELNNVCNEANPQGALKSACNIIGILCPG